MLEDMTKHTKIELAYRHVRRAAQLMRDDLNDIAGTGDPEEELDEETCALMDQYNRIIMVLDSLEAPKSEWPSNDGKCQVVDLNTYRMKQLESVCKGG